MKRIATRCTLAFILLLTAPLAAAQGKTEPRRDLEGIRETIIAKQCHDERQKAGKDKDAVAMLVNKEAQKMYCNCMPAETIRLEARMTDKTSKDEMLKVLREATDLCYTRSLRRTIPATCPTIGAALRGKTDIQAYCGCIEGKLLSLTDTQLQAEIDQALKDVKSKDLPPSVHEVVAIGHFGEQCRAEAK